MSPTCVGRTREYTDEIGSVMLDVVVDRSGTTTTADDKAYPTYYQYNSAGQMVLKAEPSALMPYNWADPSLYEGNRDLIGFGSGDYANILDHQGLIDTTSYYSSTSGTISESVAGGVAGYIDETFVQNGEDGTPVKQSTQTYLKRAVGAISVYPVAATTVYRNSDGSGGETTSYGYTWLSGSLRPQSETITAPTITTAENGPNSSTSQTTFFDVYGRPIWTKDADGFINYTAYDVGSGAVTKTITDVDASKTGDFANKPSGWSTPTGGGQHLITTMEVDGLGRTTKLTDPNGNVTYTVYNDANHEVRVYPGFNAVTGATTGPIQITREYQPVESATSGQRTVYTETLTSSATPHLTDGMPDGTETISASNIQSLTRDITNDAGQVIDSDRYVDLTGATYATATPTFGTAGTTFYRAETDYDSRNRLKRVQDPNGTITRYLYDVRGLLKQTWVGTDDTPTSGFWSPSNTAGTNLVLVTENRYDEVSSFQEAPAAPTLSEYNDDEGLGNRTYYVEVTYLNVDGIETNASAVSSLLVHDDKLLQVTSPASVGTATKYNVYAGTSLTDLFKQNSSPITLGTNWTESPFGLEVDTVAPPSFADGLLTTVIDHPTGAANTTADRVTQMRYDWRDRLVLTKTGALLTSDGLSNISGESSGTQRQIIYQDLDNLGEVTAVSQYDGDGIYVTASRNIDVPNAGFESPDEGTGSSAFEYGPSDANWDFDASDEDDNGDPLGSGLSGNGSGFTASNPNAPEGDQLAFIQGVASFSQTLGGLNTETYTISFKAAQRANFQDAEQNFEVIVDSSVVGTFTPAGTSYGSYSTDLFTLSAGSHTITFQGLNSEGGDNTVFIDQIKLTASPPSNLLRDKTTISYDEFGRVYRTSVFSVDQSDGTVGDSIDTNTWFDKRGNVIKTQTTGGPATKNVYDGAGRAIRTFTSDSSDDAAAGASGNWSDAGTVTGDTVLTQDETLYDGDGNPIETVHKDRDHDASGTGPLGGYLVQSGPAQVVARQLFYNDSYYDGNDTAANSSDDGAIAPDVQALLPGQTATVANYTGYGDGINGIMVDIANLPGTPTASDFTFKVGNDNSPGGWSSAPTPASVTVRTGAGVNGSDRVTIIWANGDIFKKWLQVTVNATSATGLSDPDVFYFGNLGPDSNGDGTVNNADAFQFNKHYLETGDTITSIYDLNKDQTVNNADAFIFNNYYLQSITLLAPSLSFRTSYTSNYFDAADRPTDSINMGTKGGAPYARPESAASRSATALVTSYSYDDGGRVKDVTDPKGLVSRTTYDLLGRQTKVVDDYTDGTPTANTNQTTIYTYDGDDHVTSLTADMPSGTHDQTTAYIYGVTTGGGSAVNSNDLLAKVEYPSKTTGAASTSASDDEVYTYNAVGDATTFTDRNGSIHTYAYDVLDRPTSDAVTTLGSGVDGAIRRIETTYDTAGRPYLFSSYNASSSGTLVSQVERTFNGLGQLTKEYQEHSGTVNTSSTLFVGYSYDTTNSSGALTHGSRLTSMTYPNGRVLDYGYSSGLDSNISRLSYLADDAGTGAGHIEEYSYLGLDTVVKRAHPGDGDDLTYIKQSGEKVGDAGDQYTGLDRFGRVVDQRWIVAGSPTPTTTDRFLYGYDADSNPLFKNNTLSASDSELYTYDDLNRLTTMRRGTLTDANSDGVLDTVTAANLNQSISGSKASWTLDALGNWSTSGIATGNGSTEPTLTSTSRTNNDQNELTGVGGNTLTFDNNGNTTTDETGNKLVYDAWDQLVSYNNSSNSALITYGYDSLGRRIKESPTGGSANDLYYSRQWQVLEERQSSTVTRQNVWSPVYVDAMVLRDDNLAGSSTYGKTSGGLTQRLYVQQDANYNTAALITSSGSVAQRFVYDPYGAAMVLNSSWGSTSDSYDWKYLAQGLRYDGNSGIYDARSRDYRPSLGRPVQGDHSGYIDGANYYQWEQSTPTRHTDPFGFGFWLSVGNVVLSTLAGAGTGAVAGIGTGAVGGAVVGGVAGAGVGAIPGAAAGAAAGGTAGLFSGAVCGLITGVRNELKGSPTPNQAVKSGAISGGIGGSTAGVLPGALAGIGPGTIAGEGAGVVAGSAAGGAETSTANAIAGGISKGAKNAVNTGSEAARRALTTEECAKAANGFRQIGNMNTKANADLVKGFNNARADWLEGKGPWPGNDANAWGKGQ